MRGLRPGGGAAGEERPAEVSSCCATSCSCQLSLRRAEILAAHNSIPALMSGWRAEEALAAARTKLRLTRELGDQLATLLPSALLELHEMSSLAQVPPWKTTFPPSTCVVLCAGAGPPGGGDLALRGGGAAAVRAARPLLRGRVRAEAAADTAGVPAARGQPGAVGGRSPEYQNK